tara:strand:- start:2550 stop:2927 length:378 start_codon:yes stop_codon:yes gene_type:complete
MNLNQVTIPSLDVPRAIQFYQKLGLKLIVHTHDAYARFECVDGEATFSIHQVDRMPEGQTAIIYFEVETIAEKVVVLKKKGITFDTEITKQSWGWTEAKLKDPDGNPIIIYHAGKNRKNPPWRLK